MANIKICSENAAGEATYSASSTTSGFPASNIGLRDTSLKWKSGAEVFKAFRFTLTAPALASALALSHHNAQANDQWRVRVGTSQFDVDYTRGVDPALLYPFITYGGATNGTMINESGVVVAMTQPRLDHDPSRYKNGFKYSDDLSNSLWTRTNVAAVDAQTLDFGAAAALIRQFLGDPLTGAVVISGYARLVSGDGSFKFRVFDGATTQDSATLVATGEWARFSANVTTAATSGAAVCGVLKAVGAGVLQLKRLQIEHGATATEPRATTTSRLYRRVGRLREPARTNLMLRSADFNDAIWTKGNASITVNAASSPNGSTEADRLVENTANSSHSALQSATVSADGQLSASVWVKAAVGVRHFRMDVTSAGSNGFRVLVDLTTRAVYSSTAFGTGSLEADSAKVQLFPGGWVRVSVGGKVDAAATTATVTLYMLDSLTSGTAAYTGDGSSAVDLWGAQLENANGTSSYIPTTVSTVARTIDTATAPDGSDLNVGTSEGTLYVAMIPGDSFVASTATTSTEAGVTDGTANNRVRIRFLRDATQPTTDAIVDNGGSTTWDSANTNITEGTEVRTALAYKANEFAFHVSGGTPATNTALAVPSGLNTINLDLAITRPCWHTREAYWDRRLTDAQLAALVASGPGASGVGYDSGFIDCLQMPYGYRTPPQDWGGAYDLVEHFTEQPITSGVVEFYTADHASPPAFTDGKIQVGRMFLGRSSWQPAYNAEYGAQSGWQDMTTFNRTPTGKKIFNTKPRYRVASLAFPVLSEAEGEQVHELIGFSGTAREVLYLHDPDDRAANQQFGFIGMLSQLDPLRAPWFAHYEQAFQLERQQ